MTAPPPALSAPNHLPLQVAPAAPSAPASAADRYRAPDVLRGVAMLWMAVYHFCYDLWHFGYLHTRFLSDPVWLWQRTVIVSLFLLTAGMGQAFAVAHEREPRRFWRRWAAIAACALLITAVTRVLSPHNFIYFGVLHGMAVMLLLLRGLTHRWPALHPRTLVLLGLALLVGHALAVAALQQQPAPVQAFFNSPLPSVLGLITAKPITSDYVPLLPWLAIMLWGAAAGQWLMQQRPGWLRSTLGLPPLLARPLAGLGRWPLSFYMLHQPLLFGLLALWSQWR